MINTIKMVYPYKEGFVVTEDNVILKIPENWAFLPSGDPGVTRKITSRCDCYRVHIKKGRRVISTGLWALSDSIAQAKADVENIRSTDVYKKNQLNSKKRREKKQEEYGVEFTEAVKKYLSFADCYKEYANTMAEVITAHSIPVGSGTVARTVMISLEDRVAKAVIAWMRHKTTEYDTFRIPLIKGKRREVRRSLASDSIKLLANYRKGIEIDSNCPLKNVLDYL